LAGARELHAVLEKCHDRLRRHRAIAKLDELIDRGILLREQRNGFDANGPLAQKSGWALRQRGRTGLFEQRDDHKDIKMCGGAFEQHCRANRSSAAERIRCGGRDQQKFLAFDHFAGRFLKNAMARPVEGGLASHPLANRSISAVMAAGTSSRDSPSSSQ